MRDAGPAGLALQLGDTFNARRSLERRPDLRGLHAVSLAEAVAEIRRGDRSRRRHVVITGAPPSGEIGFSLAALVGLYLGARRITLLDTASEAATSDGVMRFLSGSGPLVAGQLASSAVVLPFQRMAASLIATLPRTHTPNGAATLRRVLYVRPHVGTPSTVGGSVTHSHEVIRSLRKLGVEVDAVTTDDAIAATAAAEDDPPCRWETVRISPLLKAIPASAAFGADLALARRKLARARRSDLIYQRHARFSLAGPLLAALARRPLFLEYNGSEAFFGAEWQRTPLLAQLAACEDAVLAAASRVIVVADVERRSLIERGVEPDRIVVNPNGVDAGRFAVGGGDAVRRELGLDPSAIVAGFVGSFGPWHGAPVLAEAFAEAAGACPELQLLFVGDGLEREATERILEAGRLRPRARFAGRIRPGDVHRYVDACDILVSPHVPLPGGAEFFGSPTKLFEYMAAGKAIVASRLGQIADVLEDGTTAILVAPGEPSELAAGLLQLARRPDLRAELGAGARNAALMHHGWDRNARAIVEAYRSLREENAARQ
jgi:glycosyltransferase involved in cell wall biosynthesis